MICLYFYICFCNLFEQITEKLYWQLETRTKKLRFTLPFTLLAFPVYLVSLWMSSSPGNSTQLCWMNDSTETELNLYPQKKERQLNLLYGCLNVLQWYRSPGKTGSHFLPSSDLFSPKEKSDVIVSTTCWCIMISLLVALACVFGPVPVLMLYGVPYLVRYTIHY